MKAALLLAALATFASRPCRADDMADNCTDPKFITSFMDGYNAAQEDKGLRWIDVKDTKFISHGKGENMMPLVCEASVMAVAFPDQWFRVRWTFNLNHLGKLIWRNELLGETH